jgi:monovalent cation:proton antiporter-2 (CPA2) family protein
MEHAPAWLTNSLIYLSAAVIVVPLSKALGLGSIIGYLAAGIAIGPWGLGLVTNVEDILHFAEFGVVLMLFLVGLELEPRRLWSLRRPIFGWGSAQVLGCAALLFAAALLAGASWRVGLVASLGLALSSTAIALQVMGERNLLPTSSGQAGFSILLFQDVAAIPILALLPLLAGAPETNGAAGGSWLLDFGKIVGVIAAIILGGRQVLRPLLRWIAKSKTPEIFTAASLLLVVAIAALMQLVGLSMALGAFLAGVLLAESEYRRELETDIEPFKGLLLGLFFIAVGMSIDLLRVRAEPLLIGGGVLVLLLVKGLVLYVVAWRPGRLRPRDGLKLAAVLALGGEFAFVVFTEAYRYRLLDAVLRDRLVAVVGLSMAAAPLILIGLTNWLQVNPEKPKEDRAADVIDHETPRVIIAGFGRMGQIVGRMLRAQRIPFTALEHSVEQVELMRRFGTMIYYGDPSRADLLRAAHVERAEAFVLTTDDPETSVRTARLLRRLYPNLKIFARARNRQHAFKLMDLGVQGVIRETFHSSLEMGEQVMQALGLPPETARERRERFQAHDERILREQHLVYDDEAALIASSQQAREDLEKLFEADETPEPGDSGFRIRDS